MKERKIIPVFFATDNNYLPYLTVAISSLVKNAKKDYDYKLYILHTHTLGDDAKQLATYNGDGVSIEFVDVSDCVKKLGSYFCVRDYYSDAIYYRLFIVNRFPQYDKVVYLDSDTVVLGDISEFYNVDLKDNLIGAISDQVVGNIPVFIQYVNDALGIKADEYFNSGVILLNLKKLREENFYEKFHDIITSYPFRVAPDQDCLNLICKGRVHYFPMEWNLMPISGLQEKPPKIMHYNLAEKPWHYEGIPYGEYFWEYAKDTCFFDRILKDRDSFTSEMARADKEGGEGLMALALAEAIKEDNYIRSRQKKQA